MSEMEAKLIAFIEKQLQEEQKEVTTLHQTLVFLPVGIPGMGKTTLGRYLELASQNIKLTLIKGNIHFTRVSYDIVFSQL